MSFVFKEVLLIHSNLVTQKDFLLQNNLSVMMLIFFYTKENVLIFDQISFLLMLVENNRNLIAAKFLLTRTIITEKSIQRLMFQSVVLHMHIYIFYIEVF